ncbi:ATP/GTP-binding protein [Diaminobutyricimonas sp. LJ205]|uniref:AAA family ATPase n=1 Tax=Diaminobutyricimonas sp. LJ205 TaxID=2683590 RepID=UPI0012F4F98E|nr:ATP-binding protein [Diaminobutyricimonas sp. LJ205]
MILLRFTVRNHKSIREEVTIDLTRPTLRTLAPKSGAWGDYVYTLAGIFGPNASGKSAVLDAMNYAFTAIRNSSTTWQARTKMPRVPFRLDGRSREEPSKYVLEFVHDGRRHEYGFELDSKGVLTEWLREASGRWRTLFERRRGQRAVKLGSSMRVLGDVSDRELALSRAYVLEHPQLFPIATDLIASFDIVSVKDSHREVRLRNIAESLVDGSITSLDIETLLQVADIGIRAVTVEEKDLPERVQRALQLFKRAMNEGDTGDVEKAGDKDGMTSEELEEEDSKQIVRNLLFTHRGESDDCPPFSINQESDGTVAWLALMVPVTETLREGGLLCIDEIDSSLHPHLLDVVLGLFADPRLNRKHAQLIFTSHETYILSPLSEIDLEPEQVWFTDKSYDGVTEITCLAEFPRHGDANVAKRYLSGRYGGTPRLAPSMLETLLISEDA